MIFRQMCQGRTRLDDRGGVTVFVAVCVIALIGIIGVAVDGGSKMRATERADYIAGEAARAGGQAIDPAAAINGTAIVVDPQAAAAAAQAYLRSAGASGTVTVSGDNKTLTVTITSSYDTKFLSVAGIGSLSVTGPARPPSCTASPLPKKDEETDAHRHPLPRRSWRPHLGPAPPSGPEPAGAGCRGRRTALAARLGHPGDLGVQR
jgi:Flp pilus assembly protein TadG